MCNDEYFFLFPVNAPVFSSFTANKYYFRTKIQIVKGFSFNTSEFSSFL